MGMRRTVPARRQRGFVLISVLLVLTVMVATVGVTLREAGAGLREVRSVKSRELVLAAMEHGVNDAMDRLQAMDPAALGDPRNNWDIFDAAVPGQAFVGPVPYPTTGDYAGAMQVRVGLRQGQRSRPPPGEDVRTTYGHIVEIQLSVRINSFGAEAEERAAVGLSVPQVSSHAQ